MKRSRAIAVILASATLGAGCVSTPKASEDIGVKRVGLALAFKDETLAKPVEPKILVTILPAPPQVVAEVAPELAPFTAPTTPVRRVVPPLPLCPAAPADAAPEAPAPLSISKAPVAGRYRLFNDGTIKVSAPPLNITLPYPPITILEIKNVKTTTPPPLAPGLPAVPVTTFDAVETLTPTTTVAESFSYDDTALRLTARTITNGTATSRIVPTPAPRVYDFAGVGTSWTDVGSDVGGKQAVAIQDAIRSNRVVDMCGTLIDTFEVTATIQYVDLGTAATSGTQTGHNDLYDVAPQLGGLYARRELHTQDIINTGAAPVTLTYDVVSVLGQATPGFK
jgi:hypothetical protein